MLNQLLASYRAPPNSFDEMLDASRQPRPHWRTLLEGLGAESPYMMRERIETVQEQVRENGVTYNVYTDSKGIQRPWDLNVLPLILPQDEWTGIEAAVIQRATLMNQILGDVYGDQRMLEEGLLPPELIHGHAGFSRPCHGMQHADGIALHFYAVDLARAPNGQWWVVADRTQAPSGAGYALENRAIIARTFPDLLRDLKVQHLTEFFNTMRDSLAHWGRLCAANGNGGKNGAPLRSSEAPLIVLLTPGPYNETYYEQAYLARYLGLPLVEGGDLTVRNGIVWLKTLSGMQRVHVIMRRVDDDFCDPLELRPDSGLGVAGLTEAARRGNVLIANSLGSSMLESGALLGFLPALCERLLGESLKMPSVATWWCGEPAALEEAIEKLDELIIKPAFPQSRQFPVFGQDLKGAARAAFIAKMRAEPENYVAQEMVRLSQGPVWKGDGLSACAIGLRVYACATPLGYVVMPGGLTRAATGTDARIITMQRGGGSKDTWVQGNEQVATQSLSKRTTTRDDLVRDDTHLSSRMAENLFWFGRSADRCDNIARLLRVTLHLLFNVRPAYRGAEWPTVEALCVYFHLIDIKELDPELAARLALQSQSQGQSQSQTLGQTQSQMQSLVPGAIIKPAAMFSDAQIESTLLRAVISPDVPGLARQQQQLYGIASQLRERLSVDNWRALNRMVPRETSDDHRLSQAEAMTILDDATASLMTMAGFTLDGMTRDLGWRFLSLGRRLERLQFQSVILQRALVMDANGNLDWLLELSDSIVTYRSRYRAQPEWLPVLDLLLLDETNPRSIFFQLDGILKSLRKIAVTYGPCGAERFTPLKEELLALAPETDLYCGNAQLINLLYRMQLASEAVSEQISVQFFSYTDSYQDRTRKA
ncbi:circularly permuted type 2 ATP-grasp protein [Glaciimonas immobilis]|uniref:Putative circularly permuted ATP-grasp superfamily protein/putative alpha-E superfamily protein n=1 Tax=Glaciimonas immobilis TaxID=728004 RepID=A0A840RY40_9BURK|nr:circularly permuted type 2 ATP-grasp protein [Glaciimonas immobilis]KAF3998698.1 circularly permuted type 2 ATP-grasp protein [Glaciimonas immobilis]MBB5201574.1 putative circularly permuted ATP-grasp superfamily protein/putative alpha-E superfamily protein [Glaciimonas immobilis]